MPPRHSRTKIVSQSPKKKLLEIRNKDHDYTRVGWLLHNDLNQTYRQHRVHARTTKNSRVACKLALGGIWMHKALVWVVCQVLVAMAQHCWRVARWVRRPGPQWASAGPPPAQPRGRHAACSTCCSLPAASGPAPARAPL